MKNHFQDLMHAQKGYAHLEEGKLSSESENVYSPLRTPSRGFISWTELASRFLCILMFIGGAFMFAAARPLQQSDRECATQLSMWCMYRGRSLISGFIVDLGTDVQFDC